jgi:hypothetical protein
VELPTDAEKWACLAVIVQVIVAKLLKASAAIKAAGRALASAAIKAAGWLTISRRGAECIVDTKRPVRLVGRPAFVHAMAHPRATGDPDPIGA